MNVQIMIRGRQFNVRTDDDGSKIRAMAKELDVKLTEQATRARTFDEHSVAIITALNILSESFLMREQLSERVEELERELASVIALLESFIPKEDQ